MINVLVIICWCYVSFLVNKIMHDGNKHVRPIVPKKQKQFQCTVKHWWKTVQTFSCDRMKKSIPELIS